MRAGHCDRAEKKDSSRTSQASGVPTASPLPRGNLYDGRKVHGTPNHTHNYSQMHTYAASTVGKRPRSHEHAFAQISRVATSTTDEMSMEHPTSHSRLLPDAHIRRLYGGQKARLTRARMRPHVTTGMGVYTSRASCFSAPHWPPLRSKPALCRSSRPSS